MQTHTVDYEYKANPYVNSPTARLTRFVCSCGQKGIWYVYEGNASKRGAIHLSTHTNS